MIDFTDPAYRRDPHGALRRLRDVDPIHKHKDGFWMATRHADVRVLNRDSRLGRDLRKIRGGGPNTIYKPYPTLLELHANSMMHLDPPDHTRIRRLVSYAFTPVAIAQMLHTVERKAEKFLAALPDEGPIDLISQVAKPLPIAIVADLLGVPEEDFPILEHWSAAISSVVEVGVTRRQVMLAEEAAVSFREYLREFVAKRRRELGDGLVDRMISAEALTDAITESELIYNVILIFVAGHETVTNLIGNGVHALLRNPGELERLRSHPELLGSAVEECLRYDSPANTNARCTLEDVEIGGKVIRKGDLVLCMLGAANRDPEVFADPDRFDIGRNPNPHESFGGGVHYCIGAPLARLQGRVAFGKLLERYRHLELDESRVAWSSRVNLRGLAELGIDVRR